jgi:hypothetical protein
LIAADTQILSDAGELIQSLYTGQGAIVADAQEPPDTGEVI